MARNWRYATRARSAASVTARRCLRCAIPYNFTLAIQTFRDPLITASNVRVSAWYGAASGNYQSKKEGVFLVGRNAFVSIGFGLSRELRRRNNERGQKISFLERYSNSSSASGNHRVGFLSWISFCRGTSKGKIHRSSFYISLTIALQSIALSRRVL